MIKFTTHILSNGLKVILHQDKTSQMLAVNVLYNVGARDENPNHTGFAHLFEHLMFGGSVNVKNYDSELQKAGGENNAYTTNDLTNYYIQLPKQNLETALWLESDRMLKLAFEKKSLEVQKKVVCEEFKEHYLNKPYGDVWKLIREMSYTTHPYQWMTIGKELSHIENSNITDVKTFFDKHYNPANAILSVAGDFKIHDTLMLIEKWFGDIPAGKKYNRNLPQEPQQQTARLTEIVKDVPSNAFYKCWHITNRLNPNYYVADVLSDILGQGDSARLYQQLLKEKKLFSSVNSYHLGSLDNGLFVIEGKLNDGVTYNQVEQAVATEIDKLKTELIDTLELEKIKTQIETALEFDKTSVLNKANLLAFYELLGDSNMINQETDKYQNVTNIMLRDYVNKIFVPENSNTLYYKSDK